MDIQVDDLHSPCGKGGGYQQVESKHDDPIGGVGNKREEPKKVRVDRIMEY